MISKILSSVRDFEKKSANKIPPDQRPLFHLTPYTGWMNDPNGFSFYNDKYHLFYQYNPYDTKWDTMHWGHAVSEDMLRWEYVPAALAPDTKYDSDGCFSGSSVELLNGKQLLMYTGVHIEYGDKKALQTQCIAVGNGLDYEKYSNNPVLTADDLPKGMSRYDFRDPKIWRDSDGYYNCIVGACNKYGNGAILLYKSKDAFKWNYCNILAKNKNILSRMWECPDFFKLQDMNILVLSSQNMHADGFKHFDKNGVFYLIGKYTDGNNEFLIENKLPVDYGKDFYAPQTTVTPDGRRVMIGWLQNWTDVSAFKHKDFQWIGQMSLPRELTIKKGRLIQKPIEEIKKYRCKKVQYSNVLINGEISLKDVNGRIIDLELVIKPAHNKIFKRFSVKFAIGKKTYASLTYYPKKSLLKYKRVFFSDKALNEDEQTCRIISKDITLNLRIILDKYSAEIFINNGEQVISSVLLNQPDAEGILFCSEGEVLLDVIKYTLS